MKRHAAVVFAMTVALAGCSNSDINAVKKQTLGQDQSYTVEQVFDHRKVCDSIKWDEITDGRGRKIVEYRCTFNGVDDYVNNALANATNNLKAKNQSAKDAYVKDAQDDLNSVERRLALMMASSSASELSNNIPDDELEAKIKHAHDLIDLLEKARVEQNFDKILVTDFWDGVGEAEVNNDPLHKAVVAYQDEVKAGDGGPSNHALWAHQVQVDLGDISSTIMDEEQILQNRIVISEARLDVINAKKKFDSIQANKEQAFASLDADLSAKLQQLDANAVASADEVFQWSMSENGDPAFIFAGVEYTHKNGKQNQANYDNAGTQRAIEAMIRNDTTNYAQYVTETRLGG